MLINEGRSWSPFSEDAMNKYREMTGQQNISTATVQTDIQTLRDRGFIWQSGRGAYVLEDESFAEWFWHWRAKKA